MADRINCMGCGQFVDVTTATAYFIPDSDYTIERTDWLCTSCAEEEDNDHSPYYAKTRPGDYGLEEVWK